MSERTPTEDELRAAVAKQMRFLVTSGNLVAQGDYDEAVRLATSLRVLLHDTTSSHSVLGQLGWKAKLQYVNSLRLMELAPGIVVTLGTDSGETVGETFGLVVLRNDATGNFHYVAPLGEEAVTTTLSFNDWWTNRSIYADGTAKFSRWDLVDAMAHRDGGAHVDRRGLTHDYADFKLRGAGVVSIALPPGTQGLPQTITPEMWEQRSYPGDAAGPTVLQIAWELLETLSRAGLPQGPAPT